MTVAHVVVDGRRASTGVALAGVPCEACGALTTLPIVETTSSLTASVDPSTAPAEPSTTIANPPAVVTVASAAPPSSSTEPSTEPSSDLVAAFAPDVLERIRARWTEPTEAQLALAARFEALLERRWSTPSEHTALVKRAAAEDALAFIGQRYRSVLDVVNNEPRARAAQAELLTLATAMLTIPTDAPAAADGASAWKTAFAVLIFLGAGACTWWLMRPFLTGAISVGGSP